MSDKVDLPLPLLPVPGHAPLAAHDLWGRPADPADAVAWLDGVPALCEARNLYRAILASIFVDPAAAETAIDAAFLELEGQRIGWLDAIQQLRDRLDAEPVSFGSFRQGQAEHVARLNLRSLAPAFGDYMSLRQTQLMERRQTVQQQLKQDAVDLPAVSAEAIAFCHACVDLCGKNEEKLRQLTELWFSDAYQSYVAELKELAAAAGIRTGVTGGPEYVEAAVAWLAVNQPRSGFQEAHVSSLRRSLRIASYVERILTIVGKRV